MDPVGIAETTLTTTPGIRERPRPKADSGPSHWSEMSCWPLPCTGSEEHTSWYTQPIDSFVSHRFGCVVRLRQRGALRRVVLGDADGFEARAGDAQRRRAIAARRTLMFHRVLGREAAHDLGKRAAGPRHPDHDHRPRPGRPRTARARVLAVPTRLADQQVARWVRIQLRQALLNATRTAAGALLHFQPGGGPENCRACRDDALPCAPGEPGADGRLCPYREHALISPHEHEPWGSAARLPGPAAARVAWARDRDRYERSGLGLGPPATATSRRSRSCCRPPKLAWLRHWLPTGVHPTKPSSALQSWKATTARRRGAGLTALPPDDYLKEDIGNDPVDERRATLI
jgi:hypothetical protein